jgi:transposase
MTLAEVIYQRRLRVLEHASRTSVTEACRVFGLSRTTFYRWQDHVARYGLDALMPKSRRTPSQPNTTPPWQIEIVLAEALARPTLGARQLLEPLAERGVHLSASGVQKILRRVNLAKRAQRVAALAQITAVDSGLVAEQALDGAFGSATSPRGQAIWWPWTASTSVSSRASARCSSSPPWTPRPAGRSRS